MRRFTGVGKVPASLDAILYHDPASLRAARRSEDVLINRYIARLSGSELTGMLRYRKSSSHSPRRSTISSTTRRTIAAKRTPCSRRIIGNEATPSLT